MIPSAVENVRPRWQEQPLSVSGPPHGRLSAVGRLRNNLALILVALYLLLNWGFQQIRIPPVGSGGVPAAELFLLLFLLTINPLRTLAQLSRSICVLPFIGWWFFGLGRAAVDVAGGGFWALRDAAHVIESLFLVVGFVFAANPASLERFFKWLPGLLSIAVCYGLLYPVRELLWTVSPYIISPNGIPVPIFGIMANSGFLLIMAGLYLLLFRPRNVATVTLAMILIAYPVAVIQARTLYLTVIALFGFVVVFRPSARGHILAIVALSAFALAVLSLIGLQVEGRLGVSLSPEFVVNHFLAIFGICPPGQEMVCAAAAGVPQRLAWWQDILGRMLSDPLKLLLGLGYGVVLTEFHSNLSVAVREPHNSYITIFARMGVIGLICWLSMMAILVRRWYWTFLRCGEFGWRIGQNRLMILMVFFICMWVLAIGEDGFEKPYNIVPFYFFWGIVLRFSLHLKEGTIGPDAITRDQRLKA